MSYPKLWSGARVGEVLTTESRQKARDLFLQTHRPFRRIRLDFCKERGGLGPFIDERGLLELVQSGPLDADNRLFLIVGEAGSGKSELCQWLEYSADERRSLPVHIPRSMTSAAHVAALLRSRLGGTHVLRPLGRTPIRAQAQHVALTAVVLLYEQGGASLVPRDRWAAALTSAGVRGAIAEHLAAAAAGRRGHALLGDDAALADLLGETGLDLHPPAPAELRTLLARAAEQSLWLGDLRELLGDLSKQALAQGRRALLLIEDVTAFQLLGDRLLDHLLDLASGHFDAVIGVTTGYERTRLAAATIAGDLTHIHHRLRARCALTDDDGRSYGLEEDVAELARAYLGAVRSAGHAGEPFGDGLYPFTETALRRALACLHEEGGPRQTPRLLLEHVLGATLLAEDAPPETLDRSAHLLRPPALFRTDDAPDARLQQLLRWYGEVGETEVALDRRIADAWGIPVPEALVEQGQLRLSRAYVPQPADLDAGQQSWHVELRELQGWLGDGGLYPSRETLKRGIEQVLLSLGDPRALGSARSISTARAEVVYARGDERLPIVLGRDSGDQPSTDAYVKIQVRGTPEERGLLEELAYLQLSGQPIDQICQLPTLTLAWARERWDEYHAEIRGALERRLGLGLDELIWTAWRLASGLAGAPWSTHPPTRRREEGAEAYPTATPWLPAEHPTCYASGEELLAFHEVARRLFIGSFTLRDTLLDRERCAAMAARDRGDGLIRAVARIPLRTLQTLPFKIRPPGQPLYGFLAPLQRHALALAQLDVAEALRRDRRDLEARLAHVAAQEGLALDRLRDQIGELRWRCGELGVAWTEAWDGAAQTLAGMTLADLDAMREELAQLQGAVAERSAAGCDLWAYQELRHRLRLALARPYWAAYTALESVQRALLRAAHARYRGAGRAVTEAREYRALARMARSIWEEVGGEAKPSDG